MLRVAQRPEHKVAHRGAKQASADDFGRVYMVPDVAKPEHSDRVTCQESGVQVCEMIFIQFILTFQARLAAGEGLPRDVQRTVAPKGEEEDAHAGLLEEFDHDTAVQGRSARGNGATPAATTDF